MVERVVQSEQISIDENGARDPDVLAERAGYSLRDARFAVSWVAVEKHPSPAIDRWSEFGQQVGRDEQVRECSLQVFAVGMLLLHRLQLDRLDVLFEWNRGCPEVGGLLQMSSSAFASCVGESMDVVIHGGRAKIDRQLLHFEAVEDWLDQSEWKSDLVSDIAPGGFATVE
jgi:hypothetical protein